MEVVQKLLGWSVVRHYIVVFVSLGCNFAIFNGMLGLGANVQTANMIAYLIGGQINFAGHDRYTYKHRKLPAKRWRSRWVKFMSGQFAGFTTNSLVAAVLVLLQAPTLVVYWVAMSVSGTLVFVWIRYISHRAPTTQPPPPCVEH
jgi:putative flippase GtrA